MLSCKTNLFALLLVFAKDLNEGIATTGIQQMYDSTASSGQLYCKEIPNCYLDSTTRTTG